MFFTKWLDAPHRITNLPSAINLMEIIQDELIRICNQRIDADEEWRNQLSDEFSYTLSEWNRVQEEEFPYSACLEYLLELMEKLDAYVGRIMRIQYDVSVTSKPNNFNDSDLSKWFTLKNARKGIVGNAKELIDPEWVGRWKLPEPRYMPAISFE